MQRSGVKFSKFALFFIELYDSGLRECSVWMPNLENHKQYRTDFSFNCSHGFASGSGIKNLTEIRIRNLF
jgi:hypothetical protein